MSVSSSFTTYSIMKIIDKPGIQELYILILLMAVNFSCILLNQYVVNVGGINSRFAHKKNILKAVVKKKYAFMESKKYGDSINKYKDSRVQDKSLYSALSAIAVAIGNIAVFCILLKINLPWKYVASSLSIILILGIVSFFVSHKISRLMYDFWQKYMNNTRRYNYFADVLTQKKYMEEKKIFGYKSYFVSLFDKEFDIASEDNKELGKHRIILELKNDLVYVLFIVLELAFFIWCYYAEMLTIGFLVSIIPFTSNCFFSLCSAFLAINDILQVNKFYEDVEKLVTQENEFGDGLWLRDNMKYAIEIKNVIFTYPNQTDPVICDLSINFEKGKKYALVGVNGSGKTTIAKLIGGLYKPQEGNICCSTAPVILFQDFNHYPFSVAENIALKKAVDSKKIREVIAHAGLGDVISALKKQSETELTNLKQDGVDLSGGQWQRIALARILYNDSEIIILDEPTASLDPLIEVEIYKNYMQLLEGKTVIFITHRLGYLKDVDEILVLDKGKIVEKGDHYTLIRNPESIYGKMYEEQKSIYEE